MMSFPLLRSASASEVSPSPCRSSQKKTHARAFWRRLAALAVPAAMLGGAIPAAAQNTFPATAVGTPAAVQNVSVSNSGGSVTVEVLTAGAQNGDFTSSTTSCSSSTCTVPVTFTPKYPGMRTGAVVLIDGSNNVQGTALLSGIGNGGTGVIVPGTMQTYAGNGDWKSGWGDNGPATSAELFLPSSVVLDGVGNLYIADSNHNSIRMACSGTATTVAGTSCPAASVISTVANTSGQPGASGDGASASAAKLSTPSGVAIDGAGNLYIADTGNGEIREILAANGKIQTVATGLNQPTGVAVDASGNVFISDSGDSSVYAICAVGGASLFGRTCGAQGSQIAIIGAGTLSAPYTLAFDTSWNLLITDSGHNMVRALCAGASPIAGAACSSAGALVTVAGNGTKAFGGDKQAAINAELNSPSGVAADPAGNVYIGDTQNMRVRKVNAAGVITTVGGNGDSAFEGDNIPATQTGLFGPYGLVLDPTGNLYVAEYLDMRIRRVQSNLSIVSFNTPVRQGSTSPTVPVTVENDGNGSLGLTSIQPDPNVSIDTTVATPCQGGSSLTPDQQCIVGAVFAPAATPPLSSNQNESGNIDVSDEVVAGTPGANSPLVIQVSGIATPVNSTTTVLTSNLNPSKFGQNVTFTATVTTGSGTGNLTGNVIFKDGTATLTPGNGIAVNASGVATFTTPALTVGLHSITATYNADGADTQHFASTSSALSQAVNEATQTILTSNANPSGVGSSVTFTAAVSITGGGGVNPDGSVTFTDGANVLGTVTLNAVGIATISTSTLADGLHAIVATYSGDPANYILGSTATLSQDVQAPSSIVVAAAPNPAFYGSPVTMTATVTGSGSLAPTGAVRFLDGANQIGTANIVGTGGVATFTTTSLSTGTHAITASYVGDDNNGPGTSAPIIETITLTQTATSVSATPTPGIAGRTVAITAAVKVTQGAGTVTGSVTFSDGTTRLGAAPITGNGTATINAMLAPGAHALTAVYSGDTNDNPSTSAPLALAVNLATTSVALTSSASPAYVLSNITFTATVTGNGGIPSGTVNFQVDGANAGSGTLSATGVATFTDASLSVGTHTITATYTGDTNDNPSTSSPLSQVVQSIPTTTSLGQSTTTATGQQIVLVATVIGNAGPTPTGMVTFSNGSTVIGQSAVDSTGVATLVPDLPPGNYNIVAVYSGDSIHGTSTSAPLKFTSTPVDFGVSVNPPTLTIPTTKNATVTITLNSETDFTDTIGMGCLSLPAAVNCHFSSQTVNLKSGAIQTVQLTIDTNNPLSGGQTASIARPGNGGFSLATLFLPGTLLLGLGAWRFRKRNAAFLVTAIALFLSGAALVTGCGGFSQSSATPGTYTIQIGGVGANSNVSHYQNVTLTITK